MSEISSRAPEPMKARDLKTEINWGGPDPLAPVAHLLRGNAGPWMADLKIDGCRATLVMGTEWNRFAGTRSGSFPQFRDAVVPALAGTVLDGEFVAPDRPGTSLLNNSAGLFASGPRRAAELQRTWGPGRFIVFDVLAVRGTIVTGHSYAERRRHLEIIVSILDAEYPDCGISVVPQIPATVEAVTEAIAGGAEGVVLKHRDSHYYAGQRPEGAWLKIKAMSTADVYVTGSTPGKGSNSGQVGSVEVAITAPDGSVRVVANCNIPPEWRRKISAGDGTLRPEFLGTVIEIMGHGLGRNGLVNLPTFVGLRPDKRPADCGETQIALFPAV
jgi:ATP-dependent DNA ligase